MGVNLEDTIKNIFGFLERMYAHHLTNAEHADGDNEHLTQYRTYALRACLLCLVGTFIFVDKSVYQVDIVYLRYFIDFEWIHEYN